MKIKTSNEALPLLHFGQGWKTVIVVVSVVLVLNAIVGVTFALKFTRIKSWLHDHGYQAINPYNKSRIVLKRVPEVLKYAVLPEFIDAADQPVPELNIDVKFKHLEKIRAKRAEALEVGVLLKGEDDLVPATIRIGSTAVKAKIRLKGDIPDHLRGHKWSFRIETKGDGQVLGMRRFSVQHPRTRGFHLQRLFNETLYHFDGLAPRYEPVRVRLNGDDLGIMYLEEHFSKELLESQGRREGVIVRFDEDALWRQRAALRVAGRHDARFGLRSYGYQNAKIKAFQSSKVARNPRLAQDNEMAVGLLRAYVEGNLAASEVFDAGAMGRYLAVSELWGAEHGVFWLNMRFYFNPITARLEPIGFDENVHQRVPVGSQILQAVRFRQVDRHFTLKLLDDPEIRSAYNDTIRQLYRDIVDNGKLLDILKKTQEEQLSILLHEFYFLGRFDFDELVERATFLARMVGMDPDEGTDARDYPLVAHVGVIEDASGSYLEIANATPLKVRVEGISWVKIDGAATLDFQASNGLQLPITLEPLPNGEHPDYQRFRFVPPDDVNAYQLVVDVELIGTGAKSRIVAERYFAPLYRSPIPQSSVEEQLAQHPFLSLDAADRWLTVKPGTWSVTGFLAVPEGFRLIVPAGTVLEFEPDGALVSRGALMFQGSETAPVVLRGRDVPGQTDKSTWLGVAVLEADTTSEWSYTKVLDTTGMRVGNWELTGGVTFYQSDVEMEQGLFDGHRGEDALNIIRSEFLLKDVKIANTTSDAFDADFSDGRVEGGLFENVGLAGGGDGVDISGADVVVIGTEFRNIGDKSLSVGERSRMTASNITADNVGTGAASKDGSHLVIQDSFINSARVAGLLAYVKKLEYEGASIDARNIRFGADTVRARAQTNSTITIDGETIPSEEIDIDQLYRTFMSSELKQ